MRRTSLGAMLVAGFALAAPASAQQARVSVRTAVSDSVAELRRALEQVLLSQRALVAEIDRANQVFQRANNAVERESARARLMGLYDRMERTIGELELMQAHLQAICATQTGPDGWLGIDFQGDLDLSASPASTSFAFKKYPLIVWVQPGSPAGKAGLAAGDEILTLGEHDMVSGAIDIARLLKPGVRLPVRYRREGVIKSINVLVEPRPEGYASACPQIDMVLGPPVLAMQPKMRILRSKPNGFGFVFVDSGPAVSALPRTRMRVAVVPPREPTPELPPTPYAPVRMVGVIGGNDVIAGAVLIPLTPDAREGLGIDEGILVIDVLRGSPAMEAGLRAGDVIVAVKGRKASSIPQLKLMLDSMRDGAELKVTRRNAKPRVVVLRPR